MKHTPTLLLLALALFCAQASVIAQRTKPPSPKKVAALPLCQDQLGFANTTLSVVTTVKPAAGFQWHFQEAPSVIAQRLLTDLNKNRRSIKFIEASGQVPNLYLDVTISETNEGTRRDSAWIYVRGLAKPGILFNEKSGDAPFTDWYQAIDHLGANSVMWFQNGWNQNGPCRNKDGSYRSP